jgi:nucleotide-binding universal stress UspA family protein
MLFECANPKCSIRSEIPPKKKVLLYSHPRSGYRTHRIFSVFVRDLLALSREPRIADSAQASLNASGQEGVMSVAHLTTPAIRQSVEVFHHILMATDFSEASQCALSGAIALAAQNHAHLSVVHVLHGDWRYEILDNPPELDRERMDAQRRLEAATRDLGFGRALDSIIIRHGPVPQKVLALAEEAGADLIVIGTHGRAGLTKLALGSVAEELLRLAPCPVITFGLMANVATTPVESAFRSILFATDFGAGSAKALPYVRAMASTPSTSLVLLHMIGPMPATANLSAYAPASAAADELQEWEGSSRARSLQQLKEWWQHDATMERELEYVVGMDFLPEGVLTAAEQRHCDLIVMGANRAASPRLAAHIPWSAVHEVICHASCPVMTCAE